MLHQLRTSFKILQHHSFKMTHLIYRLAGLESALGNPFSIDFLDDPFMLFFAEKL